MPDVNQVVDLRSAPDARFIERAAVDGRIGSNFHVVFDDQPPHLREFFVVPGLAVAHISEAVAAQHRARMHNHTIAQCCAGIHRNVGINFTMVSNLHAGADDATCANPRVLSNFRPFADYNAFLHNNSGP